MRIHSAQFLKSAVQLDQCPAAEQPEFAFIGRSNVGKSSLINLLTNKDGLARVSKTPGRTREMNFFQINGAWHLVDLPGYGYAKVSKSLKEQFNDFVSNYLLERDSLIGTFVLLDARHPPQEIDLAFVRWLVEAGIPFALIYTKTDKAKKSQLEKTISQFKQAMSEWSEGEPTIFTSSSAKRTGYKEILSFIEEAMQP